MKNNRNYKWMYILKGIVFIVVAVLIFKNPVLSLLSLVAVIGMMIIFTGGLFVIGGITSRKFTKKWKWILLFGVLDIVLGILLLTSPRLSALLLVVFIGSWAVFTGVLESAFSFQIKKIGIKSWWQVLIVGILSIVMGLMILFRPEVGALSITFFIGFQFALYGTSLVIRGWQRENIAKPYQITE